MFGNDKNDTYSGRGRLKSISCETNIENNYSDPSPSISNNSNILTKKSALSDVGYIHTIIDDTDSCAVSKHLSESNNSLDKSEVENQINNYQCDNNLCSDGNDENYLNIGQEKPFLLAKDEVNVIIHPLNNIEIDNHIYPSNVIEIMKENHEIDSHAFLIAEKDNNKCSNQVKKSSITINQSFNDKLDGNFGNNYDLNFVNEPNQINIRKGDIQNDDIKIDDDFILNNLDEPTNEKLEEIELKEMIKSEIDKALERIFNDYDDNEKKVTDVSSDNVLKRKRGSSNSGCSVKECSEDLGYEIKKKRLNDSSSRCIKPNQYSLSSDTGISNVDRVSNSNGINLSSDKGASNIVESDWIDISETSKSSISDSSNAKRYNQGYKIVKNNTGSNIVSKQSECNIDILFFDSREDSVESFEDARSLKIAPRQDSGEVIEKIDNFPRNSKRRNSLLTDLKEEFMDSFADDFEVELNSLNSINNDSMKLETINNSGNISEINSIEIENETMNNSNITESNQLVQNLSQTASDLINIVMSDKVPKEQNNSSERDNESLNSCLEDSVSETTMPDSNENFQINSATETFDIIKINKEILENIHVIVNTKTNSAENNLQETTTKEEITIPTLQPYEDIHFDINNIESGLEATSANSLIVEEIYQSIKIPDNVDLPNQNVIQDSENISNEISDYDDNISKLLNYENNLNEALVHDNNTLNVVLNYENNTLHDVFSYENNTADEIVNYENKTLNEAVNYENNNLNEILNYENTLNEAVNYENNNLNEILNYESNTLNEELNYAKNTLNEVLNYANNTSNEVLNNISNNLNEVLVRGNMLGYVNYNLNEALVQENNTLNELLNYENNTLNEVLHNNSNNILDYENNTLNEVIDYERTSNQVQINSNEVKNSIEKNLNDVTCEDNGIDIKTVSTSSNLNSRSSYENLKTTEYNCNEKHVSINDFGLSHEDDPYKIKDNNVIVNDTEKDFNIKTEECSKISMTGIETTINLNQDKIKDEIQRKNIQITKDHPLLNNIVGKAEHSKDIINYPKIENIKTSHHEIDTEFHGFDYKTLFNINYKNKIKEKKNFKLSDNLPSDNLTSSVNKKMKKSSNNSLTANSTESLSDQIKVPWHEIFPTHKSHLHYPQRGIWWTCVHLVNYSRKSFQSNNIKK